MAQEKPVKFELGRSSEHRTEDDTIKIFVDGPRRPRTLEITFQRTVRVADGTDVSFLPPSLGTFPLYSTKDNQLNLPSHMVDEGGFFMPMYQREAMWINFKSEELFAIRIFVGGVNAVSGEPERKTEQTKMRQARLLAQQKCIQDYVVTPKQLWLDGIASTDGHVRQFVATPVGSGYSVEAQVTGLDVLGGLQIEVVPRKYTQEEFRLIEWIEERRACGAIISVRFLCGKGVDLACGLDDTIADVKSMVEGKLELLPEIQKLIFKGGEVKDGKTLKDCGIHYGDTLHLVRRLTGGGDPPRSWQMGVAAEGLIKQTVIRDNYHPLIWDVVKATRVSVQILNSQTFTRLTGLPTPETPITARTYAKHRLPYFDIYEEQLSGVVGHFHDVKSINELEKTNEPSWEKEQATADIQGPHGNPVIKLNETGARLRPFKPVAELERESRKVKLEG